MRPSKLLSLALCQSFLVTPYAVAAAKDPPKSQGGSNLRRPASAVHQKDVRLAAVRSNSILSSGAAIGQGRPLAMLRASSKDDAGASRTADEKAKVAPLALDSSVQTHRVKVGETQGHIASRYDTTVAVLLALNGLESGESIRAGQVLFVPSKEKNPPPHSESSSASWKRYAKAPKEKGYVEFSTYVARFAGSVVEKNGRLRPAAVQALNNLLGAGGKHPPLPERLIRLLVKVSDTFGGRPIHVVSGYRSASYYQDSRHRLSAAVDFAIAGVPNAVVRDYLRELEDVGVGYYPNSSFVHLDVRKESAYWIDYAGPGQPPRSTPNAPPASHGTKRKLLAELDALFEHAKKAIEQAGSASSTDMPKLSPPTSEARAVESDQPRGLGEASESQHESSNPVSL